MPHLCKSVTIDMVAKQNYNLSPNLYVDFEKENETIIENSASLELFLRDSDSGNRKTLEHEIQKAFIKVGYDDLANINYSAINHKQLLRLESILFNKWFVHFDIPIPSFQVTSFDEIDNQDYLKIPAGWELKELNKKSSVVDCLHSKKPTRIDFLGYTLLEVNNISSFGLLDLAGKYCISKSDYLKWTRNIEVTGGDCVITNTGRVGAVAQIPENYKFAIGRNMTAVRPNPEYLTPTYLINFLMSHYMEIETYRKTDLGTILDSLNVKGVKKILILTPPVELQLIYESFAHPIRRLIELSVENI